MKISLGLYRGLLILSSIAAIILGYFYFTSNDLKGLMIGVTVGICIYAAAVTKFGHVDISAKKEYAENKG